MTRALKIGVPIALVVLGLACAGLLVALSPTAAPSDLAPPRPRVSVVVVQPEAHGAEVSATGVVAPEHRVAISAQVAGAIVHVAPDLQPGTRLRAGDLIARVDPRDYKLALAVETQRLRQAELELRVEEGRQHVARRELELLGRDSTPAQSEMILRTPHLAVAEQAVRAAASGLARAELALERTAIRAPFNAVVEADLVGPGQVVAPGTPVAMLLGSDRFRVQVAVPVDALALLSVPGVTDGPPSTAHVVSRVGDHPAVVREGVVTGLAGRLDPQTRLASVLVAVDQPLDGEGLPLLPDAFVEVTLRGPPREGVFRVPRAAVVDGCCVWVVGPDDTLARRAIDIAWRDADAAFVTSGLAACDRVVVVPLALPIEGQAVEVLGAGG